ncbi:Hypothetical protein D9617_8g050580 [Elsinoe fawcettii]|nr:Hypothetical protein D9617_8g050580 [Elsinoe fawcettii]
MPPTRQNRGVVQKDRPSHPYTTKKKPAAPVRASTPISADSSSSSEVGSNHDGASAFRDLHRSTVRVIVGGGDFQTEQTFEIYGTHLSEVPKWFEDKFTNLDFSSSSNSIRIPFAAPEAFHLFYTFVLSGGPDPFHYHQSALSPPTVAELIECFDLARKLKAPAVQNMIVANLYQKRQDGNLFKTDLVKEIFSKKGHALIPRQCGLARFIKTWFAMHLGRADGRQHSRDMLAFAFNVLALKIRDDVDGGQIWGNVRVEEFLENPDKDAKPSVRLAVGAGADAGPGAGGDEGAHPQDDGE